MSNFTHDAAASVLLVTASLAALVAAFVAFTVRRQAVAVERPQTADRMGTTVWFGAGDKRITNGTSYDPQSRGSSG
jgi:hypothetical protein